MADIFISYKSERRQAARHLKKVLDCYFQTDSNECVWYDYGIIPGDDFEPRIMAEIATAKVVLVLWCGMAVKSRWVLKQAREAQRTGKFLPIRIETCALPSGFEGADTINLSEWDASPRNLLLDRLLSDIGRRLGREAISRIARLRELEENWRSYGAPSLAHFALGDALEPGEAAPASTAAPALGAPPDGLSANLLQHWRNARAGNAAALVQIGWLFERGQGGVSEDKRKAARLYRLAADRGNAGGQGNLGTMYENGCGGLPQDDREAVRLFKLAADQGDALGQVKLGYMHSKGRGGLAQNQREAARLYKLSADQGVAEAQSNLGFMYDHGLGGLAKDAHEAARFFRLAADQNYAAAQFNLGTMYEQGRGVPKDEQEAVRLYTLATEQGYNNARYYLALMYAAGIGVSKDDREAVRLFQLAARSGYESAENELKRRGETW